MQWYYAEQGQQKGPVEDSTLDDLVRAGVVRDDTLVWHQGMSGWQPHATARGGAAGVPVLSAPVHVSGRRYAGFWIRFAAVFIDAIILNIVLLVIRIPFGLAMFGPGIRGNPAAIGAIIGATALVTLLSIAISACYEIFFIANRGATIGKMIFGLKVIRADGGPISLGLSTGRYFAKFLSSIILLIGYIMAGFDDQKRALHDRICETRVVYAK